MHRNYRYFYLLFLLVRRCITSIEDLNPLGGDVINNNDNSLFNSADDNNILLSSLNPDDNNKVLFSDLNDPGSNLAAAAADDMSPYLNPDGGNKLHFGDLNVAGSDLAAADDGSLFNLEGQDEAFGSHLLASDDPANDSSGNSGSSSSDELNLLDPLLKADTNGKNPSNCNSNIYGDTNTDNEDPQPPSRRIRNRPRSTTTINNINNNEDICPEADLNPQLTPPPAPREGYLTPVPFLETDEELKRFFCPAEMFQGILNTPVCALFDDFGLVGSDGGGGFASSSLEEGVLGPLLLSNLNMNWRLVEIRVGKLSKLVLLFFSTLLFAFASPPFFPSL